MPYAGSSPRPIAEPTPPIEYFATHEVVGEKLCRRTSNPSPTLDHERPVAASRVSCVLGSPAAFIIATLLVIAWAVCGPHFVYSDAWQLVINTSTTIGTFLTLFVLQNLQNRDTKALNLKLDELLRANDAARNRLADLKDATDDELEELEGARLAQ